MPITRAKARTARAVIAMIGARAGLVPNGADHRRHVARAAPDRAPIVHREIARAGRGRVGIAPVETGGTTAATTTDRLAKRHARRPPR